MTTRWMPEAKVVDLSGSRGNGPFSRFLGVILHVNVARDGTSDSFWRNNADQVTPNFQVYKSEAAGGVHQMLPFNWQPWCQRDGNFNYAAIETAGMPDEPLTDYQLRAIARILRIYRADFGMKLQLANKPGAKGLGTHVMGGPSWGGHSCPGAIRAAQRAQILTLAKASGGAPAKPATPTPTKPEALMVTKEDEKAIRAIVRSEVAAAIDGDGGVVDWIKAAKAQAAEQGEQIHTDLQHLTALVQERAK